MLRCFLAFAAVGLFVGGALSATPEDMLLYVGIFRNADSAAQYIKAVRWMYTYLNRDITWESQKLKQALRGGHKLQKALNASKPRPAIRWLLLARLVDHAWQRSMFAFAAGYVIAANFLLRCQSELVDMDFSQLCFDTNATPVTVTLKLHCRKNMPHGATLTRKCICHSYPRLCPVHIFSRLVDATKRAMVGKIFQFSYSAFQNTMRVHLRDLGVEGYQDYSTKAFRRGTAQEMVATGSSLAEVLSAGQWRSAAFLLYLRRADIEEDAVFAAFDQLSDDEEASPGDAAAPHSRLRGAKRVGDVDLDIPSRKKLDTPVDFSLESDAIGDQKRKDKKDKKVKKDKKHKKDKKEKKDKRDKKRDSDAVGGPATLAPLAPEVAGSDLLTTRAPDRSHALASPVTGGNRAHSAQAADLDIWPEMFDILCQREDSP